VDLYLKEMKYENEKEREADVRLRGDNNKIE